MDLSNLTPCTNTYISSRYNSPDAFWQRKAKAEVFRRVLIKRIKGIIKRIIRIKRIAKPNAKTLQIPNLSTKKKVGGSGVPFTKNPSYVFKSRLDHIYRKSSKF